jgi:hypothetical protein
VDIDGLDHHYSTQDTVEEACGQHLGDRFSLGKRAPLDAPQLQTLIGNLSDTEAAQSYWITITQFHPIGIPPQLIFSEQQQRLDWN